MHSATVQSPFSSWTEAEPQTRIQCGEQKSQLSSLDDNPKREPGTEPRPRAEEDVLVGRAMKGDSQAQDILFGRHRSRLYRLALRLLRSKEDAEDAVQDALLSAYRNLSSFEGRSLFSTWLTRIVVNAALVRMRRQRARPELFLGDVSPEEQFSVVNTLVDWRPDPEQMYSSVETRRLVEGALEELSPSIRLAFQLRELQGLSNMEAATLAGVQVGAFKSRISRARSQLAERLSPLAFAPLQKPFSVCIPPMRQITPEEPAHSYAS
jgi:RNA polymerase sigma-70 factor, ECF subfamily